MASTNVSFVPLQQAFLCLDCEAITPANKTCLACGSHALLNIARVLNEPSPRPRWAVNPIPISLAIHNGGKSHQGSTGESIRSAEQQLLRLPFRISENRA